MTADDLDRATRKALLDSDGPHFEELMLLVDELEMELTIARHGYHKDNAFASRSLDARLADATYRERLVALIDDRLAERDIEPDDPVHTAQLLAIRDLLSALSS